MLRAVLSEARRLPPPDDDADWISRVIESRDPEALEWLVRRYAGLVLGVCRRTLGSGPDADDAFQTTFLVLLQKLHTVRDPARLPGWLQRVAVRACVKLLARKPASVRDIAPLQTPEAAVMQRESAAAIDGAMAMLPPKLHRVAVACLLAGRTSADVAAELGIPVGTVDSRLHSARGRLKKSLFRAGHALTLFTGVARASEDLIRRTMQSATQSWDGTLSVDSLIHLLGKEVASTMTTTSLRTIIGTSLAVLLLGGLGSGLMLANSKDSPAAQPAAIAPAPAKLEAPKAPTTSLLSTMTSETGKSIARLDNPAMFEKPIKGETLLSVLEKLSEQTGLTYRVDEVWFRGLGDPNLENIYEKQLIIPVVKGLSVRDILDEICNQLTPGRNLEAPTSIRTGYLVKGRQVIIGEGYVTISVPNGLGNPSNTEDREVFVTPLKISERLHGPTVSISMNDKTLPEIVEYLREQTGANIAIHASDPTSLNKKISLTVNDTKLYTVLRVAADMCDLGLASFENIFYITTPEKAKEINAETLKTLYGTTKKPPAKK
jgi:RNA polymerase sigma factor (sigma-70 family)